MILAKTNRNIATLANVACTRNKPISKRRRPNLRPSASLLVKRQINGRRAMFNKFLKRTLFLTIASTGRIVGSVYAPTHRTRELDDPAPQKSEIDQTPQLGRTMNMVYLLSLWLPYRLPTQWEMATDNGGTLTAKLWELTIGARLAYPTEKVILWKELWCP